MLVEVSKLLQCYMDLFTVEGFILTRIIVGIKMKLCVVNARTKGKGVMIFSVILH